MLILRKFVTAMFTFLALQRLSMFTILRSERVEIYASQPLVLLCFSFIFLAMGGTALLGRKQYKNFSLWVLLLLIPSVYLLVNSLMMLSTNYHPLFTWGELLTYRSTQPVIFYGRILFVSLLLLFWLLAASMLIDAYVYDCRKRATTPINDDTECHRIEIRFVLNWAVIIIGCIVPLCIPHLAPHIIYNIVLLVAIALSTHGYKHLAHCLHTRQEGRLASVLIERHLSPLLNMEHGGITEWGIQIDTNPFFCGNPMLEDVAYALGVRSDDISDYIASKNTNLVAWVSDQRLRHCAQQLTDTDRKISEIAASCGYNDLPSFTRAFKRQFNQAPSIYRQKHQK
jgi:AraC-like DNA-binding protein